MASKKKTPPGNPPDPSLAEVHEQLFRTPKHGHGRLKVGGNNGGGRPRNELRRMVEDIGIKLAAPRLAHVIATGDDRAAVQASSVVLQHALPTKLEVEGEVEHRYVIVVPAKARSTKEWLKLHGEGKA